MKLSSRFSLAIFLFIWLAGMAGLTAPAAAQTGTLTGRVLEDGTSQSIPGANILIEGAAQGAVTDSAGQYTISGVEPGTYTVRASFIGYGDETRQGVEVEAGGTTTVNFVMQQEATGLNEVVVVGYGEQQRRDLTGSVSTVSADEIEAVPAETIDMKLQGRVAGLNIVQSSAEPGGGTRMRIRGSNSLLGSNEPLVVVDGFPVEGGEASGSVRGGSGTNALANLSPDDIESVQVLKDASASAIYGSRASNGVILIETKTGSTTGQRNIHFTSEVGVSDLSGLPDPMTGRQYAEVRNELAAREGEELPYGGGGNTPEEIGAGTNWLSLLTRTAVTQRYEGGVRGGDASTQYYVSASYLKDAGVVRSSDFSRGTARLNMSTNLSEEFSIDTRLDFSYVVNQRIQNSTGSYPRSGPIFEALESNPTLPARTPAGELLRFDPETGDLYKNPLVEALDTHDRTENGSYDARLKAEYQLLDPLKIVARGRASYTMSEREFFYPRSTSRGFNNNISGKNNVLNRQVYDIESFLDFNRSFADIHSLHTTAGMSWRDVTSEILNSDASNFTTDKLGVHNLAGGLNDNITTYRSDVGLLSYYARANYRLMDRYLLTLTGRADASSKFAENHKWAFFPSGALAWRASEEPFLNDVDFLSNLKFRVSYGLTGNQAIPPYGSLATLAFTQYPLGTSVVSGVSPGGFANSDLRWESTEQLDVGLDLGLFDNRLSLTADYYDKTTHDLLMRLPIPISSGYLQSIQNVGSIRNRGIEFDLEADVLDGQGYRWTSGLNFSHNKSKILDLAGTEVQPPFGLASNILGPPANLIKEGEPFGAFYGYKVDGLLQPDDFDENGQPTVPVVNAASAPGHWKYVDVNGDSLITPADRTIIGNPNPDFTFGWSNDINYHRFSLSIFIQGTVGNDLMNLNNAFFRSGYTGSNQVQEWYENRWTEDNQHNDPRYPIYGTDRSEVRPNSVLVEDGSYVRLRNVSLTYRVPTGFLPQLQNLRLYAKATNLYTLTSYSGFDPEVSSGPLSLSPGLDYGSYPRSRTFTLGARLGF